MWQLLRQPTTSGSGYLEEQVRRELCERGRITGLIAGLMALVSGPTWSLFDYLLEPELAARFLFVRILTLLPMSVFMWMLWRTDVGRRHPGMLTTATLGMVQLEIVWMLPQVHHLELYLLGATLMLYGAGAGLATHPGWTGALAAITVAGATAVGIFGMSTRDQSELLAAAWYLGTACGASLMAHTVRYHSLCGEIRSRAALAVEQRHTQELLVEVQRINDEDPLTGAANRRHWDRELATACFGTSQGGGGLAVLLLDVDHFKTINDSCGHAAGDQALQDVVGVMRGHVRNGDLVARLGGDEFAILLYDCDMTLAGRVAERIRDEVSKLSSGPHEVRMTVSLGIAMGEGADLAPDALLAHADKQLYRAKESRNLVAFDDGSSYRPVMDESSR